MGARIGFALSVRAENGEQVIPVEVEFDGKDVALVKPVVQQALSAEERYFLRQFNRAHHRKDDELVLRWVRVKKKSDGK